MKSIAFLAAIISFASFYCKAQTTVKKNTEAATAAIKFLESLSPQQKKTAQFAYEDDERYNWNYVPIARKGIVFKELNASQRNAAMNLLHSALSDEGYKKTRAIMELESVLKVLENRADTDYHRDPEKYFFSIFGTPSAGNIWGWRFEGHHISFNFSSDSHQLMWGTPGFLGTNPAVVLTGNQKGKEVLKEEAALGFDLLHSFSEAQMHKAMISDTAPADIVTVASRKAIIKEQQGISYKELHDDQKQIFNKLLALYLDRYTKKMATQLRQDVKKDGINNLRFAWAGATQPGVGHPHYYRIQGPGIIIEYDNTQNNANHAHSVVRDLRHDFGGDQLLKHYQNHKH